jgi:hypothetical protein
MAAALWKNTECETHRDSKAHREPAFQDVQAFAEPEERENDSTRRKLYMYE